MEQAAVAVVGGFLIIVGLIGCVVPALPGPVIGYVALWTPVVFGAAYSWKTLAVCAGITVAVTLLDYILPSFFAKKLKCSKAGVMGCLVGTVVGLFFLPWGIVLGPVLGTVVFELTAGRSFVEAAKGGLGAFLGFTFCLLLKLASVIVFAMILFAGLTE